MGENIYKNGLNFECTKCSNCCRFEPGFVFLSYKDLDRLLSFFNLQKSEFIEKYCRIIQMGDQKRLSLIEKANYDCIFWSNGGCEIYGIRPLQCRSYPFWKPFLIDRESWDREAESCPGMNHGKVVDKNTIEYWVRIRDNEEYVLL